jgi:hypothetical protein
MSASSPPPVVRVRLPCSSLREYRATLASHHAVQGIFIPSGRSRPRPVGSRLQLKIELGDRTLAYAGAAVVVAVADAHGRPGLILNLEEVGGAARDGAIAAIELPARAGPAATAAPGRPPRWDWPSDQIFATDDPARWPVGPEPADAAGLEEVEAELIEPGVPERPTGPAGVGPQHLAARAPPALAAAPERSTPPPRAGRAAAPRRLGRTLAVVLVASVVVPCVAGGAALVRHHRRRAAASEAEVSRVLLLADERLVAGRLVLPRGDSALDHLLAARKLRPEDGRALARLELLADTFEALAGRALLRGDLEEAAAHLAGAVRADPRRDRARAELEGVEARRRTRQPPQPHAAGGGWGTSG